MIDTVSPAILVAAAGAATGLLLALRLLLDHSPRRAANRLLALIVLAVVLLTVGDVLNRSRLILRWPHFELAFDWLIFALGPLVWLYVRYATGQPVVGRVRTALHFIPVAFALLVSTPVFLMSVDEKRQAALRDLAVAGTSVDPLQWVAAMHVLVYLALGLWVLARFRRRLKDSYSSIERIELRWLTVNLGLVFASWATWVLFLLVHSPLTDVLNLVVVPLALYGLAFMALIRRDEPQAVLAHVAAEPAPPLAGVASADAETSTRYRRSGLTAERAAAYRERLETVMTLEKPWLENDLTLPTLAERANLPPHHLSQVLNEALGETFFDFINRHRVAEVQRCLADPAYRGQSLLEIALAAGFNSKTAFNSAFRAHTGTTPSTWRRMHAQWNGSAESAGRS